MPLALTTTFTPAASCLSSIYYFEEDGSTRLQLGPPSTSDCLPSSYQADPLFYYSPGVCPWSYTTACWSMTTNQDGAAVRETVATCCPRNYACMTTVSQGWDFQSTLPCESPWPSGDGSGPTTVTATALLNGVTSLTVRTVSSLDAINNYGVIVRRQATDNVPSSAAATATAARTGSDIHQGATVTATATSPSSSSSSASAERSTGGSAGLSTAAKAGIGIGAVLLVVSALALGFLVGRRNKQKGRRRGGGGGAGSPVEHVFSPGGDLKGGPLPRGFGRSEVDGRAQRLELPGVRDAVHELYGDEAAADRGRGR